MTMIGVMVMIVMGIIWTMTWHIKLRMIPHLKYFCRLCRNNNVNRDPDQVLDLSENVSYCHLFNLFVQSCFEEAQSLLQVAPSGDYRYYQMKMAKANDDGWLSGSWWQLRWERARLAWGSDCLSGSVTSAYSSGPILQVRLETNIFIITNIILFT